MSQFNCADAGPISRTVSAGETVLLAWLFVADLDSDPALLLLKPLEYRIESDDVTLATLLQLFCVFSPL